MVPSVLFFLLLVASVSATQPYECLDPPGNGAIADVIVDTLNASRSIIAEGIPSLGIPPLDPFGPLPRIVFNIDTEGLRMDFDLNDTTVMNLAQFIICQVNVSVGISQKFSMDLMLDDFHIEGLYDLDGSVAYILPVFGSGKYRIDANNAGFTGGGKLSYSVFHNKLTLKDFNMDIFFDTLDVELDAIFGGGDMSDLVNSVIGEIAGPMFNAVWQAIRPTLTKAVEDGINAILANITIANIDSTAPRQLVKEGDMGNANDYVDLVMTTVDTIIKWSGFEPVSLPNENLTVADAEVKLYNGELAGLSTLHRTGTCTLDKVADWYFLYANIGVKDLEARYTASVKVLGIGPVAEIDVKINNIAIYFVARRNVYTEKTDMDQFIITEFGHIDVNIDGLGLLDYLLGPISEAVANLLRGTISDMLETSIKDFILKALDETPWPMLE